MYAPLTIDLTKRSHVNSVGSNITWKRTINP